MRTGNKYLGRGAPFLALWALIVAGFLAVPLRDGPHHELSTAVAAAQLAATGDHSDPPGTASEADRRYQAARRAKRLERVVIVAVLVYFPPFALLFVGWLVSWIARSVRSA